MDDASEWEASGLFSPSKARAQQAQSKDWAVVDAWLARKYGATKRLPNFERNEETLHILLGLANHNDTADEQRALIERVERASVQGWVKNSIHDNAAGAPHDSVLRNINADGRESLQTLSETAILTGTLDPITMASRVCDLTTEHFEAGEQLNNAVTQLQALERERTRVQGLFDDLRSSALNVSPELAEQTTEWVRNTKHLRAKIAEYDEQLNALSAERGPRTKIEDVIKALGELEQERDRLQNLQAQLANYQAMPADPKAANEKSTLR